jgi:diguanylate cyclase (GGDEF)-like protein
VRDLDTAARLGGDEFAIIQASIAVPDGPLVLAERLLAAFREPFHVSGHEISIGISIGIALYPAHAKNSDELLKASDIALYMAKHAGRDCASVFADTIHTVKQNAGLRHN